MKYFFVLFLLVFHSLQPFAQSDAIKNLEKTTAKLTGQDYLANAFTLVDWYYNEGFFEQSAEWADNAYNSAKKLKQQPDMAKSLNLKGKALMKITGKRPAKNKAYKAFEESNEITTDADLKLDNLLQLRELAVQLERSKDLEKIQREIALLNGGSAKVEGKAVAIGKKAQEEIQKAQEQNQSLSAAVNDLSKEKAKLAQQRQALQGLIAAKEVAIQNMTEAQIRQELIFSEQSRMLDSMQFAGAMDSMELSQKESLLQRQQAELDLNKSQRNLLMAVIGLVVVLGIGLFFRYQTISKHNAVLSEKNRIIEEERKRSEELLLNILPATIADELKKNGSAEARRYESATVLFTDFIGFSHISKKLSAEKLVNDLDYAFKHFDQIIGKYGLEKIKTIGDSYMCAGGIPDDGSGHPRDVVRAALEIQTFLQTWNKQKQKIGEPAFEARIGIHTGPLVAGVVGSRKFAYDIWGDTVNIASRMETSSEAGRVNISFNTYNYVKDEFKCEYRGKVPAKNVGEVEMYFVNEN